MIIQERVTTMISIPAPITIFVMMERRLVTVCLALGSIQPILTMMVIMIFSFPLGLLILVLQMQARHMSLIQILLPLLRELATMLILGSRQTGIFELTEERRVVFLLV